jgi:mono/diheme cytochrome c family protein
VTRPKVDDTFRPDEQEQNFMRSDLVKGVLATTLGVGLVAGLIMARPATAQDVLPEGPGKAETLAACSGCHGIGQILGEHRAADMWATTVTSMINNGAPVADADFDKVVTYLATNFGPEGQAPAAAAPAAPAAAAPPAEATPAAPAPAAPAEAAPAAPAAAAPAGNFPPVAAGATPIPPAQ